jgi:CheY-like chemotaxis protein
MQNYGTILVIDDNEAILTALKYCLGGTFERVMTLSSPDSVLSLLGQEEVDIILLDMNFTLGVNSGQDGLLWLQAIRKHHPEIPVVLITAYADVSLAVRGLKRGAAVVGEALDALFVLEHGGNGRAAHFQRLAQFLTGIDQMPVFVSRCLQLCDEFITVMLFPVFDDQQVV